MPAILIIIAAAEAAILTAFAGGYGYHRDELYFIAAGKQLDWAYADQGPVTPLIARAMTELAPDSLTMLRLPSALAAGLIVLLTGLIARELGGSRRAVVLAAVTSGLAVIVLFNGHLLSTSTFDLLAWTAATWLIVKAVRGNEKLWLAVGLVLGIGLLNKPLPAFLAVGLLAGIAIAGPRRILRNPYLWAGAALALVLFVPFLVWQAAHGWPQLDVSRSIAAGGSTSSEPWWAMIPFQFLLVSPVLAPVWISGLVRLLRDPGVRDLRFLGWTWAVLAVLFMLTGGKPYYLAGLLPLLIAAGAGPAMAWVQRATWRKFALGAALVSSAVIDPIIALPVLPVDSVDFVVDMNEDVGETIGWPELAATVARVHDGMPDTTVIYAGNYGLAGAIDRFGPEHGLPRAYSGHNAYYDWGVPPDGSAPVIVLGPSPVEAAEYFDGCTVAAKVTNAAGVDNGENGTPVLRCDGPQRPWSQLWPSLRRLG